MEDSPQTEARFRPLRTAIIGLTLFFGFVPWIVATWEYVFNPSSTAPWIIAPFGTIWDAVACHYAAWLFLHALEALAQMERPGGPAAATVDQVKLVLLAGEPLLATPFLLRFKLFGRVATTSSEPEGDHRLGWFILTMPYVITAWGMISSQLSFLPHAQFQAYTEGIWRASRREVGSCGVVAVVAGEGRMYV